MTEDTNNPDSKFYFAIDRGGTFTDIYAKCPGGKKRVLKLLSVDPANYPDAPREGIRRILEQESGTSMPIDKPLDTSKIGFIRMGTTVATNALLERKGERMALVITKGFKDLLYIGNQSRPNLFDLSIACPDVLYESIVEVDERVILQQNDCQLNVEGGVFIGKTGEKVIVWKPIDIESLKRDLKKVYEKGIRSLAIVLMHSYTYPDHEEEVGRVAMEMGFTQVSLSSSVMPMVKIVPRGYTASVDAYLTPCIKQYLAGFQSGFDENLKNSKLLFMQSDGGLTPVQSFNGSSAILSGPAGGVVGYAMTSYNSETKQAVIGFDMGGTSTDVSRYAGKYEHVFETTTAGVIIQAPQLDINTVAAGGGSMLFFRSGMFVVGPDSAGAHPGPACYRKEGPLTVTDANLVLGRILTEHFPKIFGPTEDQPLDKEASLKLFIELTKHVNDFMSHENPSHSHMSVEEVAMGFIDVANESMCRPIRALTQAKGHDTAQHALACFGGAGGQHACSIAQSLGMKKVYIHKYSGILSAYGMALADCVHECQEPAACSYDEDNMKYLDERIDHLTKVCHDELKMQGFNENQIKTEPFLNLRYDRTDCALMCSPDVANQTLKHGDFRSVFNARYKTEFGFLISSRKILVDDIRVRGSASFFAVDDDCPDVKPSADVLESVQCFFHGGYHTTSLHRLECLQHDSMIVGPSIIIDKNSTIVVEPDCCATITSKGDVEISVGSGIVKKVGTDLDSIQLSIFSHRFMSIAEQMGRILQRTAISTNIKERLDFSCALFGPDGGLVSNAPHIPVHLGAMQEAVQYQMREIGDKIKDGDHILSNHPQAGGSHLPDLTVITPVFRPGGLKPIFFVANRGHHADIGGITPGSMPPHSTSLEQEGAVFKSFFLVKEGKFQEEAVTEALMAPAQYEGCSGTRNLHDNLADLRAQVAANQRGIQLVNELVNGYGLDVVQAYMSHIQHNAEVAVRDMLKDISTKNKSDDGGDVVLNAVDYMDDGTPINLNIKINHEEGSAVFDFEGTGPMTLGNTNAPRAITLSALIYCLRCMVPYDIPLNQGCLAPVTVKLPRWCLLDPEEHAAVVGGNVLTSQRLCDVVLKAFKACAASQGCTNNITFGDEHVGYYETVAGGAGAGPQWHGRSGVHTHMTNTRITDPEILEKRYSIILQCFNLNAGTGGNGKYKGGDGVRREILFRKPLILSILSERRVFCPYGLNGGSSGKTGKNLLFRKNGPIINLGGKNSVQARPGDIFHLETPGGGGYGSSDECAVERKQDATFVPRGSLFDYQQLQEAH